VFEQAMLCENATGAASTAEAEDPYVAICKLQKFDDAPKIVALVPHKEEPYNDEESRKPKLCPEGFHVVYLPWKDDVRQRQMDESVPSVECPSADALKHAKNVVRTMKFTVSADRSVQQSCFWLLVRFATTL
jgi:hypothetical protein